MTVKLHYDNHLGNFYSWMLGELEPKQAELEAFFSTHDVRPFHSKVAIDLGAGSGLQAVPLARLGFAVTAIDFNARLLSELTANAKGHNINAVNDDIRNIQYYSRFDPELIVCMGDTLTHLDSQDEVATFLQDCCTALGTGGKLVLSFRDYSVPLMGDARFIPVRSDDNRILTCFLEYHNDHVTVTDILQEHTGTGWEQKVSSYNKVRVQPEIVVAILERNGMDVVFNEPVARLITMIAVRTLK